MANEQNLLPPFGHGRELTREQLSANGKKGAEASTRTYARRKSMRETLEVLLSMAPVQDSAKKLIKDLPKEADANQQSAILAAVCLKALKGDLDAAKFVRDTIGEKPDDKLNLDGGVSFRFDRLPDGEGKEDDIMG